MTAPFQRILVGIDGTESALQAGRLANRLRPESGELLAVAVAETGYAVHAGLDAPEWAGRLRQRALDAHDAVLEELGDAHVQAEVFEGRAADKLLDLIGEHEVDLVAVGRNGGSRGMGLVLGSVATRIIHDAPCSVLVADREAVASSFPQRVVVGLDGSEGAQRAGAVAGWLADELGAEVRQVVESAHPVDELVEASAGCDLVIVGSRGLHGMKSLGSVAERIAHAAECSVLIVRNR